MMRDHWRGRRKFTFPTHLFIIAQVQMLIRQTINELLHHFSLLSFFAL